MRDRDDDWLGKAHGRRGGVMRRIGLFAALGLVLVMSGAGAARAGTDPFLGGWRSIDTDGSHQSMQVDPLGAGYDAAFIRDSYASVCDGEPAKLQGRLKVDGDFMRGFADLRCPNGINFHALVTAFDYDSSTDTLVDNFGIVWVRVP
jgi:hypothetical protein